MRAFSDLSDIDLERRVQDLTRELTQLKKAAARRGSDVLGDANDAAQDLYAALADRFTSSLPAWRKRARTIEKTAYDHPATVAAIGLVVVGLAASLLLRRR